MMTNTNYWWASDPETLGGNLEGYVMDQQMEWIEKQLQVWDKNPDLRYVFLFGHEPSYPNSVHYKDAMYYSGGLPEKNGGFDRRFVIKRRNRFWRAVSSSPKMVFAMFGDEHNYSRTLIPQDSQKGFKYPVWQLISGGVGAPYYSEVKNLPWSSQVQFIDWKQNFLHISVNQGGVWLQALSSTGEIMESVKLRGEGGS